MYKCINLIRSTYNWAPWIIFYEHAWQLITHLTNLTHVCFLQFEFSLTSCNYKTTCSVNIFSLPLRVIINRQTQYTYPPSFSFPHFNRKDGYHHERTTCTIFQSFFHRCIISWFSLTVNRKKCGVYFSLQLNAFRGNFRQQFFFFCISFLLF